MKILITADIHLGKRPSRIPIDVAADFSSAQMWRRLVDFAIETEVDAVILAGDIVDEANRFYEAIGPLESGVNRLVDRQIMVYAVSGNHDYDVLPRLTDSIGADKFRLLGRGGSWQREVLLRNDRPVLQLFGWSFPGQHVRKSPLSTFPTDLVDNSIPALGILHADLDNPESQYCPVRRDEFAKCGVPLWILGHIHKPSEFDAGAHPIVMYPGSPQGMDPGPGEVEVHGPWILEYEKGAPQLRHQNFAPVAYVNLTIDITDIADSVTLQTKITDALTNSAEEYAANNSHLKVLSYRLEVAGRTSMRYAEVESQLDLLQQTGMMRNGIDVFVNKYVIHVQPRINLAELVSGKNHLAELSQLLLALDGSQSTPDDHHELVKSLQLQLSSARNSGPFLQLSVANPTHESDEEIARQLILEQAWRLVEELTGQKETYGE